jgi:hypothetical protein
MQPPARPLPAAPRPAPDAWSRVWRVLAGPAALAWVLPALLATALTLILPQAPSALAGDATARAAWLAGRPGVPTGGYALPASLAAFDLFAIELAPWYRVLLAASLLSALLGVYEAARALRAAWPRPDLERPESFFAEPQAHARWVVALAPPAALDRAAATLRRGGWRVRRAAGAAAEYLAADRPWGAAGRLLAWGGLAVLVLGCGWTAWGGWRTALVLADGQSGVPGIPSSPADVVRLDGLRDGRALLALNRDGRDVSAVAAPVGWWTPWVDNLLVRAGGEGPALHVTGEDANGQPLQLKGCQACAAAAAVTLALAEDEPERSAFVPLQQLVLVAERVPGRADAVQVNVLTAEGRSLTSELIAGERTLTVGNVVLHLGVVRYAQLDIQYMPGLALALAGIVLAVLGVGLALALPERRLWALAAPEGGVTVIKAASDAAHSAGAVAALARAFDEQRG